MKPVYNKVDSIYNYHDKIWNGKFHSEHNQNKDRAYNDVFLKVNTITNSQLLINIGRALREVAK